MSTTKMDISTKTSLKSESCFAFICLFLLVFTGFCLDSVWISLTGPNIVVRYQATTVKLLLPLGCSGQQAAAAPAGVRQLQL